MMAGPVVAVVLEGIDAVPLVRKMVGATEPKEALPGTIRGDYAHVSFEHAMAGSGKVFNLIHASGNSEEAKQEVAHWFTEAELFSYRSTAEDFIRGE
jgi:nucleoside-diphosphate kinase